MMMSLTTMAAIDMMVSTTMALNEPHLGPLLLLAKSLPFMMELKPY